MTTKYTNEDEKIFIICVQLHKKICINCEKEYETIFYEDSFCENCCEFDD